MPALDTSLLGRLPKRENPFLAQFPARRREMRPSRPLAHFVVKLVEKALRARLRLNEPANVAGKARQGTYLVTCHTSKSLPSSGHEMVDRGCLLRGCHPRPFAEGLAALLADDCPGAHGFVKGERLHRSPPRGSRRMRWDRMAAGFWPHPARNKGFFHRWRLTPCPQRVR